MKRTKEQKGITLIALIITIVVLMVLASVAISSIQNDGIIGHAGNATNKFTEEQQKEQDMLDYYNLVLSGTAWTQNGTKVTRGDVKLEVGEKVTLKAAGDTTGVAYTDSIASGATGDYTGDWVVLGVEYGKLLLVSASNVVSSVALGGAKGGNIDGTECVGGYLNGVAALDKKCGAYLNTKYADSARSIRVEDINRVTGYVPTTETTYKYTSNFWHVDGRVATTEKPITVKDTSYMYQGVEYLLESDLAYKALFSNIGDLDSYWLASPHIYRESDVHCTFNFFKVFEDYVFGGIGTMWFASDDEEQEVYHRALYDENGVRAVVSINPDVQVEEA